MDTNTNCVKKTSRKKVTTIRISDDNLDILNSIASGRELTVSDVITEAINEYLQRMHAQICSACKTCNQPDAKFCKNCGLPLNPEGLKELEDAKNLVRKNPALLYQLAQEIERK